MNRPHDSILPEFALASVEQLRGSVRQRNELLEALEGYHELLSNRYFWDLFDEAGLTADEKRDLQHRQEVAASAIAKAREESDE